MEKLFTRNGNFIKLEGITSNPSMSCYIEIDKLFAGEKIFSCSLKNVAYQLSRDEIRIAKLTAKITE